MHLNILQIRYSDLIKCNTRVVIVRILLFNSFANIKMITLGTLSRQTKPDQQPTFVLQECGLERVQGKLCTLHV